MLTLIEGGFFSGGRDIIKNEIAALVKSGGRGFLIVPEQQTVFAESELTDMLPSEYPLYFEATNFTRFANTVARELGGVAREDADSIHRALIIYKILRELKPTLKTLGKSRDISSGTVDKVISAIRKLGSLSLSSDELLQTAEELRAGYNDGRLADKLRDLAQISSMYDQILRSDFGGAEDALVKTREKLLSSSEFLSGVHIFIDGFTSFTEPQYNLISVLIAKTDVTLHLTLPKAERDAFEYTELRLAHDRLLRITAQLGMTPILKRIDGAYDTSNYILPEICDNLWRSAPDIDNSDWQNDGFIRIFEAENPYEECDFVISDIKRRVMAGARYSDFAVIARKIESYDGILTLAAEKAEVPLFMSRGGSIDSLEVIKLITSALSAVISGFSRRDIISFAKCSLSGLGPDECDIFEIYTERWQIDGERFLEERWNMNPDGFDTRSKADATEILLTVNSAKDKIMKPLSDLSEALCGECTIEQAAKHIYEFLVTLRVEEALISKSRILRDMGFTELALWSERVYSILLSTLDIIVDVLRGMTLDARAFLSILKLAFAETNIGHIPSYTDQVAAGSADVARFFGKRHIYIIGAASGIFPARVSDDGYFADREIAILKENGMRIEPECAKKSAMEYYYFTRALSYAKESLTVLYPTLDFSFAPTRPSEGVIRLLDMTDGKIPLMRLSEASVFDKAYTPEYALEHISTSSAEYPAIEAALSAVGYHDALKRAALPIKNVGIKLSMESLSMLYPGDIHTTQSRLENYSACPMRYFCTYNLSLDEDKRAEWGSNNIGNFIHAVLENFFRELRKCGKDIASLSEEERISLTREAGRKYAESAIPEGSGKDARMGVLVSRLTKYAKPIVDSLCDEFSNSKYEPIFFELEIDSKNPENPSPAAFSFDDGKRIDIFGKIDRVDAYRDGERVFLRVVDYKTGTKTFSPKDLERGENLQMFLYLKSLVESDSPEFKAALGAAPGDKLIPAGVLYVKADISDVTVKSSGEAAESLIQDKQKRIGMLLDDSDSISAMNPRYLPISYNKDGTPSAYSRDKLYDEEGWIKINRTIENAVSSICRRMTSGDINASPLAAGGHRKTCEYCSFKSICRNSNVF